MIEILQRDTDPDTGDTKDQRVCLCENEKMANLVFIALKKLLAEETDPNREVYMKNWNKH
jgi:hypothetical protein